MITENVICLVSMVYLVEYFYNLNSMFLYAMESGTLLYLDGLQLILMQGRRSDELTRKWCWMKYCLRENIKLWNCMVDITVVFETRFLKMFIRQEVRSNILAQGRKSKGPLEWIFDGMANLVDSKEEPCNHSRHRTSQEAKVVNECEGKSDDPHCKAS